MVYDLVFHAVFLKKGTTKFIFVERQFPPSLLHPNMGLLPGVTLYAGFITADTDVDCGVWNSR